MIRGHPEAGRTILDKIPFLRVRTRSSTHTTSAGTGMGYPRGLKGEEIPLGARIFPLADVFDAMTTHSSLPRWRMTDRSSPDARSRAGAERSSARMPWTLS